MREEGVGGRVKWVEEGEVGGGGVRLILRVIFNIISNSSIFSHRGGLIVTLQATRMIGGSGRVR